MRSVSWRSLHYVYVCLGTLFHTPIYIDIFMYIFHTAYSILSHSIGLNLIYPWDMIYLPPPPYHIHQVTPHNIRTPCIYTYNMRAMRYQHELPYAHILPSIHIYQIYIYIYHIQRTNLTNTSIGVH